MMLKLQTVLSRKEQKRKMGLKNSCSVEISVLKTIKISNFAFEKKIWPPPETILKNKFWPH